MRQFYLLVTMVMILSSCSEKIVEYTSYDSYPISEESLWVAYSPEATTFKLWSPTASTVRLHLYDAGDGGSPTKTISLERTENGLWKKGVKGDLKGVYYTFQVKINNEWLDETPGIYAQAVGVNGNRGMVVNLAETNPSQWEDDERVYLEKPNKAIIYELHIRDMTIHPASGSAHPGKYEGLVESGTKGPNGIATGIDHIKEMGITHVHLLPTFDHWSIDETKLDSAQFNWGYDPKNYNVPEGSFSSDPYNAAVRIKEFKEMVQAFHTEGIGVILDVVYNHTGRTQGSGFNLEVPDYYYRHWLDGSYSDAAACGNETASERAMMRKFIKESVTYWANEYHLDGFRFDLMGIHDITTMNEVTETLNKIDPSILVYGEGWTAGDSPLPIEDRALKAHMKRLPQLTAFSDDLRDGLKGSVFEDEDTGFVSGATNKEESIKFGIVGAIDHPQLDYSLVNYSKDPWTNEPWQAISYVSCHDNHTLFDKLQISRSDISLAERIEMHKLANAIVMTSQGVPFLHAGVEMLRTKKEEHNSYNLPDIINQIDWNLKSEHQEVVAYYQNLIQFRKEHPAFQLASAKDIRAHLRFTTQEDGLLSYQLSNYAGGDVWKNIYVIYNARPTLVGYKLNGDWKTGVLGNDFNTGMPINGNVEIPPHSMAVFYQE